MALDLTKKFLIQITRRDSRKGEERGGAYTMENKDTKKFPKMEIRSPNREGPKENWNFPSS